MTDIAAKKDLLPDQKGLKRYIDAKYFKNLSPPIEHELIKALWKFCFRLSNEDAEANREINTRCLHLLYKRNPIDFRRLVAQDSDYFSEISPNDAPLSELIRFLSACPALYSALNDAAKVLLMAHAKSDANLFAAALFLSDSFATHFSILKTFDYKLLIEISFANWNDLIIQARENNQLQEVFDFGIFMYINSGNFNLADSNFEKFVDKYIDEFDKERLLTLLNGIEENNQTSCRGKTWTDHPKIAKRVKAVGGIELANYPKFTCSLPPDK